MDCLSLLEHVIVTLFLAVLISIYMNKGREEFFRILLLGLKSLPGMQGLISRVLKGEVTNFVKQVNLDETTKGGKRPPRVVIPKKGIPYDELREAMAKFKAAETNHVEGKIFAYTYTLFDEHFQLQKDCFKIFGEKAGYSENHDALVSLFHQAFLHENALNPMIYPSLRRFETEVVSMAAAMLNGNENATGFLTSGGTESVLMAVKTYRDRARKLFPHIKEPNIVAPITIHPVMEKAAHYFGLKVYHAPVGPDFRVDVQAMEKLITPNTILLASSAPQFCHGIVDPIDKVSELAVRRGLPLHIDACFGGFMLPWVEKLGYSVPDWDFRVPGVTSISADIHKYGYVVKGASVVMYRNEELRKHQIFTYAEWPGGLYGSPSMAGTRPGGNIAASWAAMRALGEEGYMSKAKELMEATIKLKDGIRKIPALEIIGEPCMTCFAAQSTDPEVDILAVSDVMETKGYKMEKQQKPSSLHFSILPHHVPFVEPLLQDLAKSCDEVKANKTLAKKGSAAMYGMVATIPDKAIINDFIVEFFSEVYKCN
ncbi:uncharacterized protein LOC135464085 [Liolophura sinensis]|uniref:uncharacterized protein LOC135464085 n=1 Tax=Liolophura sinensis TaxID=3198878 RepID=UPI003157F29B